MKASAHQSLEYSLADFRLTLYKKGSDQYLKVSYPLRCGIYSIVETDECSFHFNLSHEIIRISGKTKRWPHPQEWLKRTIGNDWIYYSCGGYTGVFETIGEYYLPNLPYPANTFMQGNPFAKQEVAELIQKWHQKLRMLYKSDRKTPAEVSTFFNNAIANNPENMASKADKLFAICGGRVSVLPPDTRHVDYNVIPLSISQGCLYKCRFCKVKNNIPFTMKSPDEILEQIMQLKALFGNDLSNYNSIFLGEHDALQADPDLICFSIAEAHKRLNLAYSYLSGTNTFLFGSVSSLLNAPESLFHDLETLPGKKFINIGIESADQETLNKLGKPLTVKQSLEAFDLMQQINDRFTTIEITANFVMDDSLNDNHYISLLSLIRGRLNRPRLKGCIYLSPLQFDNPSREKLFDFYRLKVDSRLPLFLYLIQRL